MFGFALKNNYGQVAFDASLGQLMQFIGKYALSSLGFNLECAVTVTCFGSPVVFIKNTGVANGGAVLTGIINTGPNQWQIRGVGQSPTGVNGTASLEVYVFGRKTTNRPYNDYGLVVKSLTPGEPDFFDARDRVLTPACFATTQQRTGGLLVGDTAHIPALSGTVPINWAVSAFAGYGEIILQISSIAAAGFFCGVSRVDANTVDTLAPTYLRTGGIYQLALRGRFTTSPGFYFIFINTDLYQ
jgi:hypothetical protein